jgi:predicted GIY-YIG superfamily endonuclease
MAYCYLIHFKKPPRGKQSHYIGYTSDLAKRWADHCSGHGSDLTRLAKSSGISMRLARIWKNGSKELEIQLKHRGGKSLCPVCMAIEVECTLATFGLPIGAESSGQMELWSYCTS